MIAGGRAYYWFWHDLLCRHEPFTWQIARMTRRHGAFFWLVFAGGQYALYKAIEPPFWLTLAWIFFNCWLIDHEIDHILDRPEDYKDL